MYAMLMTERRLTQIAKRIEKIKAELLALGPMRPGSLTLQYMRISEERDRPFRHRDR